MRPGLGTVRGGIDGIGIVAMLVCVYTELAWMGHEAGGIPYLF